MVACISCGHDVTGKRFCPDCGTPVQPIAPQASSNQMASICPHCSGEVKPGAAFCMHCGSSLSVGTQIPSSHPTPPPPPPAFRSCPACHLQVPAESVFCTNCGSDTRVGAPPQAGSPAFCGSCGKQNTQGARFCNSCGGPLAPAPSVAQGSYAPSGQYVQQPQYQAQQYAPNNQYQQQPQQYAQSQYQQYPQPYAQSQPYPQQYGQPGYQPQPMMGQQPMILRCPTCMAISSLGTANCSGCRTSLMGVVPTPAMMQPGQQGGIGGFLQGNGGKMAMGAVGGAAAVLGAEMLMHGVENSIENRVEGDMGMGRRHHRDEGLLGGLGELADDIGL